MSDIVNIKIIDRQDVTHDLELPTDMGLNLMEACKASDLEVEGVCGGMAMCASCHCYILTDQVSLERNDSEQAMLYEVNDVEENSRLGCQIQITKNIDGLIIKLAPQQVPDNNEFNDW